MMIGALRRATAQSRHTYGPETDKRFSKITRRMTAGPCPAIQRAAAGVAVHSCPC